MNQAFQYQRLVLAYHGCNQSVADEVLLKGGALKQSQKSYDWLGNGIYFWEHGPERALEWAQGRKKAKNPTVVGAIIHLGNCFDLLDRKATKLLSEVYPDFLDGMRGLGQKVPKNESLNPDDRDFLLRRLDCSVLNWALGSIDQNQDSPTYDSVRGLFQEDEPAFEGSAIKLKSHIQIAVRNPSCSLGYFRPS